MSSSKTPLQALVPYLQTGSLSVGSLIRGLRVDLVDDAFEALDRLAEENQMEGVQRALKDLQGEATAERERATREVVEELRPVMEVRCPRLAQIASF